MRRGTTLVEAIIFGAIASLVAVGLIGLLTKGSKIVELGRQTASSASDLKILLETLSEDAAELVYLEGDGAPWVGGTGKLAFVVRSTRSESGLGAPPAGGTNLRRIEYRVEGSEKLKDVVRAVQLMGPGGPVGNASEHRLVTKGVSTLRVWPIAAIKAPANGYSFIAANTQEAKEQGATVACFVVEVEAGEAAGKTAMEQQTSTKVVTKLWCRNRMLELSRGALR